MKKTIFAIIMAAIVGLFAVSCTKTSMNTSKLIGTWKVDSVASTYKGVTETEKLDGTNTLQFVKGGTFSASSVHGSTTTTLNGTWAVIDDTIIMTSNSSYMDDYYNATWTITTLTSKSLVVTMPTGYGIMTISMSKL